MKIFVLLSLLLSAQVWAGWSVSSYNIRNFNKDPGAGATDVVELGSIIKTFKSDVMGFIEVVNLPAFQTLIKTNLPGYVLSNTTCGGFGKQKLAIVHNPKVFKFISAAEDLTFSSSTNACGSLRPGLLVTLQHIATKKTYVFAAMHLKAGGAESAMQQRWVQYETLTKLTKQYSAQNLVILGDLNTTGYNLRDIDFEHFDNFLTASKMHTMSENLGCTSYWSGPLNTGLHQASILDHIVLKQNMVDEVADVYLGSHCAKMDCKDSTPEDLGVSYESVSDHCPIQVTFK